MNLSFIHVQVRCSRRRSSGSKSTAGAAASNTIVESRRIRQVDHCAHKLSAIQFVVDICRYMLLWNMPLIVFFVNAIDSLSVAGFV